MSDQILEILEGQVFRDARWGFVPSVCMVSPGCPWRGHVSEWKDDFTFNFPGNTGACEKYDRRTTPRS